MDRFASAFGERLARDLWYRLGHCTAMISTHPLVAFLGTCGCVEMHVRPGILCFVRAFRSLWLVSSRVRPLELPAIGRRDVGFGNALLAGRTFSNCDEGRSMVLRTAAMRNVSQKRSLLARRLLSSFGRGSINQSTNTY